MDRSAWWAAVHRVAQSWRQLRWLSMHASIGEGNGNPLQYSCLENPMDRGAWWAAVYGVAQSQAQLKRLSGSSSSSMQTSQLSIIALKPETFEMIWLDIALSSGNSGDYWGWQWDLSLSCPYIRFPFHAKDDLEREVKHGTVKSNSQEFVTCVA